ncbi:MFS transporter [Thermococcus stetteri]|uniref:MFS transporter n=1 Tax=Thermococcus stetteri TaxID=49900 RepID=UPI001AE756D7|nr:MFS transporter [Thermococcus stetteri]MBP1911677.1 MFS family permease [Thermococcus stetteri]
MKARELLKFEFISQVSIGTAEGLAEAFFEVIATRLGASTFLIGLIGSAAYVSNILSPLWARLSNRAGAKRPVIGSLLLASVFLITGALFKNPLIFALFVFFYFIAYGVREVLYPAIVERVYEDPSVLSHSEVAFTIAYTIATLIAGYIMDLWSYRVTFAIAALLLVVAALSRIPFPDAREDEEKTDVLEAIKSDRTLQMMVALFMISGTGMLMMLPAIPILEVRHLNLSNTQIGLALAVESVSYALFVELWGKSISRPSHVVRVFQAGFLAIGGMAVVYYLSRSFYPVLLASFLCGVGGSAVSIGWQVFAMSVPDYRTEELSALHLTTCGIRGLYAPLLGSLVIELFGVRADFVIAGSLVLISALLAERIKKSVRESFEL